jgi:Arc/MetJ-type ribon-helix-helix transcriptional regulator
MSDEEKGQEERSRMAEGIDIIIDEAKTATKRAYKKSGAEDLSGSIKETLRGALSPRDNVVMVRLNDESLAKLDELVESGIVNSRSEAAAFLIGEGAAARSQLFERIAEKTEMIRKVKEELRSLVDEEPAETPRAPSDDKTDG